LRQSANISCREKTAGRSSPITLKIAHFSAGGEVRKEQGANFIPKKGKKPTGRGTGRKSMAQKKKRLRDAIQNRTSAQRRRIRKGLKDLSKKT